MARCYSFLILLFVVILSLADADLRVRRTPQFSQASAQAGSFGYNPRGFGGNNFGPPRPPVFARGPQFGGRSPVFGPPRFGNSGFGNPGFGNSGFGNSGFGNSGFGRPRPGGSINISKSISISTGGGGGGGARSSAGGFGK